jgi:membrane-associated phospholipid phosphatase
MLLRRRPHISYNPYFLIPFLLWVVAGGVLMICYSRRELFAFVNGHYSGIGDTLMYYATMIGQAEVIVPVLLVVMLIPAYRTRFYFINATLCNVVPLLISQLMKTYFNLPRPLKYFHDPTWAHILPNWPYLHDRSFPSGHSEGAFSFLCFLALLLPARYRKWGILLFLFALSVCYSRLYLAAHFFEDVYVGSIVGVLFTTIVFSIIKNNKELFLSKKKPDIYA